MAGGMVSNHCRRQLSGVCISVGSSAAFRERATNRLLVRSFARPFPECRGPALSVQPSPHLIQPKFRDKIATHSAAGYNGVISGCLSIEITKGLTHVKKPYLWRTYLAACRAARH